YTLSRLESSMQTSYGTVHFKEASGWGVSRKKTEYEDLAKIAGEQNISLAEAALLIENINK
ncbi:MAG: nickel insertion protein, partial [Clostridiales bacterium]